VLSSEAPRVRQQIAALSGQSQSEVLEMLNSRQVLTCDVLGRLCASLGIPREYLGLAPNAATAASMVRRSENGLVSDDESVKRLKLLAYGAGVVVGAAVFCSAPGRWLSSCAQTPVPGRIGMTEVEQVEAATRALRALDYQFGGGGCRDALVALLSWARRLLGASSTDQVRQRLFRALGDLQNLVGWTTFDVGLLDCSRSNFATALDYAQQSGDSGLIANIMYRMGRVYLHQKAANEALKWFQLGQIPAHACGSEHAVAVLCGNEAWAHAMMGDAGQADMLLGRSRDALAKVNLSEMPDWARFYNDTDLHAMVGTVHTELSAVDPQHASPAISAFDQALTGYTDSMNRSRAFTLTMLATNHFRQGNIDHAIQVGRQALALAQKVQSQRVIDRMKPLQIEAQRQSTNADSRQLSDLIRQQQPGYGLQPEQLSAEGALS
jgi:tetratricopeptide (TPR) repeat protein